MFALSSLFFTFAENMFYLNMFFFEFVSWKLIWVKSLRKYFQYIQVT